MSTRPNILWIMSDQHNANCTGYNGHPNVRTPHLDWVASMGVDFTDAYTVSAICSPSRISFITGQHVHTHGMYGNQNTEYPVSNPDTIACLFRRYGYQTAIVGKSHMVRRWDEEGFERIRYVDMVDGHRGDPTSVHYFNYLEEAGLADYYEEGKPKKGQEGVMDGSMPAELPYAFSTEHYTGDESLKFLNERDNNRPFFLKVDFQRPHAPIAPAKDQFDNYDPEDIVLPESAADYFEHRFAGKPTYMQDMFREGWRYPLADPNPKRLKRCLASYYTLITAIDSEIGRIIDHLKQTGELDNTVIIYTADHGDFAGEHGLFHKNLGIYESIHRIPMLLMFPGGPKGIRRNGMLESIDVYPTLCELCQIPTPEQVEGKSVLPLVQGNAEAKGEVYCDYELQHHRCLAVRTNEFRCVFHKCAGEWELYDLRVDKDEVTNVWGKPEYVQTQIVLMQKLLDFSMGHVQVSNFEKDRRKLHAERYAPGYLLQVKGTYWSRLKQAYEEDHHWPPDRMNVQKGRKL